jgi:hypothetical protein
LIVEVPAFSVNPVPVRPKALGNDIVTVEAFKVKEEVDAEVALSVRHVIAKFDADVFKSPAAITKLLLMLRALPSVQPPPTPLNCTPPPIVIPLVVIVLPVVVALNCIPMFQDVSSLSVILPLIVRLVPANVTVPVAPDVVISRHVNVPAAPVKVTVYVAA